MVMAKKDKGLIASICNAAVLKSAWNLYKNLLVSNT